MRHRPTHTPRPGLKATDRVARYGTICSACRRRLSRESGVWVVVDNGSPICLGEYENPDDKEVRR